MSPARLEPGNSRSQESSRTLRLPLSNPDGDTYMLQPLVHRLGSIFFPAGHYGPTSETPYKWRFADGPIVARDCMLAGFWINTYPSQDRIHQGYSANQTGSWPSVYTNKAEISIKPE